MLKIFITLLIFTYSANAYSQILENIGIENNTMLNIDEAMFLNKNLSKSNNDFDFTNKLVACMYYSEEFFFRSKIEYFTEAKAYYFQKNSLSDKIIILTKKERKKYEGVDIIIVSGFPYEIDNKTRKKMVRHLKEFVMKVYYNRELY